MADSSRSQRRADVVGKRCVDVVVSIAILSALAPVIALTALAVRITMGSPVMFRQERPGLRGELFTIMKFRTMRDGVGTDEERLTRTGRLIRAASLDELPQLMNVLRGEMSLVGPRPLLPKYLPLYDARQARRHEVLPGITGLAQINGRNELSWPERFELDVQYVEQWSLRLDLAIIWRTLFKTAAREGISAEGSATAPEFSPLATATPVPVRAEAVA